MTAPPARQSWRAKVVGWRSREYVVALGEEFGPSGPAVMDLLEEIAKEQRDDQGRVRTGLRALVRDAFLRDHGGQDLARRILEFAAAVGAIQDLAIADDASLSVTCVVAHHVDDQRRGGESVRKAQQRAAKREAEADPGPDETDPGPTEPDHAPPDDGGHSPEEPGLVPTSGTKSCRVPLQEKRGDDTEEEEGARARPPAPTDGQPPPILVEVMTILGADGLDLTVDDFACLHAIEAHPWATDDDIRRAAHNVASWAAQSTDGPRFRHAGRLLRNELDAAEAERNPKLSQRRRPAPGSSRPRRDTQAERLARLRADAERLAAEEDAIEVTP